MTMMPVRLGDPTDPWGQYAKDDLESLFGSDEELFNRIDLMGFELDDVDPSFFSSYDSEDDSDGESLTRKFRERNHDCMWGGQCCNKEFQRTTVGPVPKPQPPAPAVPVTPVPAPTHTPAPPTPGVLITHSANKVVTIVPASERTDVVVRTQKPESRSLLLNRTPVVNPKPVVNPINTYINPVKREPVEVKREPMEVKREPQSSRPDTPQSEEDDLTPIPIDPHNTTSVFRSALEAITTPTPAPSQTELWRMSATADSDHNYDGSKHIKLEGLGVVTPSDSEEDEEIDVVTLSERSSASSRSSSCSGLPTRPTRRDQQHLEEITTSLLSASKAVSQKLKASHQHHQHKRKKYRSESSDSDSDDDQSMVYKYRQTKKQKSTPTRRKKNPRFGEEEDSQEKRDLHNNMERMRRIDLRNSFEELKALVPCLAGKDRAAKVVILREAANYCDELGAESQSKCMQVMALRKEQERLRAMVSSLRKARAAATIKIR